MSQTTVRAALKAAVDHVLLGIPTEQENEPFEKPNGKKYARVFYVQSQPVAETLGPSGQDRLDGFVQIDLLYPLGKGGTTEMDSDHESIRSHFPVGKKLVASTDGQVVAIRNCGNPKRGESDNRYVVTTQVNWYAMIPR